MWCRPRLGTFQPQSEAPFQHMAHTWRKHPCWDDEMHAFSQRRVPSTPPCKHETRVSSCSCLAAAWCEPACARHGTTTPFHSPPLAVAWQDFKGQKYNERLFQTLVILFGIIG